MHPPISTGGLDLPDGYGMLEYSVDLARHDALLVRFVKAVSALNGITSLPREARAIKEEIDLIADRCERFEEWSRASHPSS